MRRRTLVLPMLFCFLVAPSLMASSPQDALERELDNAKALYRDGRLEEAVSALRTVITKLNDLGDLQNRRAGLAEAHLHLGLSYLALRDEPAAIENFRRVITLDPGRKLDPDIYSPRVITVFERARSEANRPRNDQPTERAGEGDAARVKPLESTKPSTVEPSLPRIQPGTKLRIQLTGVAKSVEGTLLALDDRTFTLGAENQRLPFPRDGVTKVEVMTKRKGHWLAGLVIGTLTGALIGAAETPGCAGNDGDCYTRAENIGYGSLGFGIVGALVGALYRTDQWAEVPVDQLAAQPATGRRLVVSFAWRH